MEIPLKHQSNLISSKHEQHVLPRTILLQYDCFPQFNSPQNFYQLMNFQIRQDAVPRTCGCPLDAHSGEY